MKPAENEELPMETDAGVCPLLGLVDDQGAYLTYPSYENRCYASRSPQTIPLNEQTFFCLGGHKERCPRYQSRQALLQAQEAQDVAGVAAAAAFADPTASDDVSLNWTEGAEDDPGDLSGAEDEVDWPQTAAGDSEWSDSGYNLPPPPPPPLLTTAADGRARRPVWPLLLAAGTLLATLMACGLLSAGWLGVRALSSQLALQPTGTALVEGGGAGTPAPTGPGGVVVVVTTPTPNPLEAIATSDAAATGTALALPTATPSPTEPFTYDTPPVQQDTATPTWTPAEIFQSPTPRDTATFFPTNTPYVAQPTSTPTWTPMPLVTVTGTAEPFNATFTATPLSIEFGQTSTLSWNVTGIKDMFINGQAISGPTGTMVVRPSVTTTYVLRMIMRDNTVRELSQVVTVSVPSPTATATTTPTPTSTPFVNVVFAQDLVITSISGQDGSCRTGSGCTLFQIQIRNVGNRPAEYQLTKTETIPIGWGVFFCWAADCEFGNAPPAKTLAAGARDTVSINFRVPSVLVDGDEAVINVSGSCPSCASPPFQSYSNTFRVLVILPTPTPLPTGTHTATPTITPTPTWTWTPTATPTTPANN